MAVHVACVPRPMTDSDFAERFNASFRALWLTALGVVRHDADAEDVVQEAAVVALRKLDQFREGTSFRAWMGQIVRFVALNRIRRHDRRHTQAVEPATLAETVPERAPGSGFKLTDSGQLPAFQDAFDDRVVEGIRRLDRTARACLLLRTVEKLDYATIAEILGIPPGTAMSHVHRSRRRLRAFLAEEESR